MYGSWSALHTIQNNMLDSVVLLFGSTLSGLAGFNSSLENARALDGLHKTLSHPYTLLTYQNVVGVKKVVGSANGTTISKWVQKIVKNVVEVGGGLRSIVFTEIHQVLSIYVSIKACTFVYTIFTCNTLNAIQLITIWMIVLCWYTWTMWRYANINHIQRKHVLKLGNWHSYIIPWKSSVYVLTVDKKGAEHIHSVRKTGGAGIHGNTS